MEPRKRIECDLALIVEPSDSITLHASHSMTVARHFFQMQNYNNIQILRGFSALYVALFHGASLFDELLFLGDAVRRFVGFGHIGVDIFFSISGFVTAISLKKIEQNNDSRHTFLIRRLARIYLGYWPFYFFLVAFALIGNHDELHNWSLLKSFFLLFLVGIDSGNSLVLFVTWSLTYEIIFYGIAAFLLRRLTDKEILALLAGSSFLTFLSIFFENSEAKPAFIAISFFVEFMLGYSCHIIITGRGKDRSRLLLLFSVAMIIGCYLGVSLDAKIGGVKTFTFGVFAFGLLGLAAMLENDKASTGKRFLILIGDSSYTIYLSHLIFFQVYGFIGGIAFFSPLRNQYFTIWLLLIYTSIIAYSIIHFKYIERPLFRNITNKILSIKTSRI